MLEIACAASTRFELAAPRSRSRSSSSSRSVLKPSAEIPRASVSHRRQGKAPVNRSYACYTDNSRRFSVATQTQRNSRCTTFYLFLRLTVKTFLAPCGWQRLLLFHSECSRQHSAHSILRRLFYTKKCLTRKDFLCRIAQMRSVCRISDTHTLPNIAPR